MRLGMSQESTMLPVSHALTPTRWFS
jgi:hypothetical protein